ncbi:MAG: TIR domain-containing protein [Steroidobacteraceae bacterium]|nr:TIR domain-containing protein [Steroidobacteraceae bacterium]
MSHVFISYARSTARQAQQVAAMLRGLGHQVWLDDAIPAHRAYADVIEERLREARAVVVIWSAEGAKSEWVRSEADRARVERKLVQMTVDGAALPMPFDQIQCADLAGWQGDPAAAGWKRVVASVAELLGGPTPTRESGQPRNTPPPPAPPDTFSVAVAPFTDPTGATAGDDFADGLVAEISTALARFPALRVMDAGPASGARYLLDGSVRRSGSRVRINVQLRDAAQGERVWAERFDSALEDPFALQEDVANTVVCRVETAILAHEFRRIGSRPIEGLSAHELWLRARETIRRAGLEQVDEIEALCERAVALDPGHGRALAFLATALGFRIAYASADADVTQLRARFTDLVNRAMVAGTDDPEVLVFVAEALLLADADMVVARALVDRAVKMNPALEVGWDVAGNIRMQGGEYDDALARYERCLHLDPQSPWRTYVWPSMAGCLVAMGRFDEAIVLAKEGLQIGPNNPWAAAYLIAALAHSGRIAEARAALTRFDPRQAGVLKTSQFGPKLTSIIDEALKLVELNC